MMFTCSVCSKRNALTYDAKTKMYFCGDHNANDLIVKEEVKEVKKPKKLKLLSSVKPLINKVFKQKKKK